jgi:hypothetical protein
MPRISLFLHWRSLAATAVAPPVFEQPDKRVPDLDRNQQAEQPRKSRRSRRRSRKEHGSEHATSCSALREVKPQAGGSASSFYALKL